MYNNNKNHSCSYRAPNFGQGYVSSSFIKNKGGIIYGVNDEWVKGYDYKQTNNVPPIPIYIRLGKSVIDPNKNVFWINGYQQPNLYLIEGKTYSFNINTYDKYFYFRNQDGDAIVNNVQPTNYAKYSLTIPKNSLSTFFYGENNDIGGKVFVLSAKDSPL